VAEKSVAFGFDEHIMRAVQCGGGAASHVKVSVRAMGKCYFYALRWKDQLNALH
jgi:hypothetical protein